MMLLFPDFYFLVPESFTTIKENIVRNPDTIVVASRGFLVQIPVRPFILQKKMICLLYLVIIIINKHKVINVYKFKTYFHFHVYSDFSDISKLVSGVFTVDLLRTYAHFDCMHYNISVVIAYWY